MNICSFQLESVQNIATETGTKQNLQSCLSFCCLNEYIYSRGALAVCQQLFIFVGPVAINCFILTWGSGKRYCFFERFKFTQQRDLIYYFFLHVAHFWKHLWISNVSKLNDALILYKRQCGLVVKNVDGHPGLMGINWPLLGIRLKALWVSVFWDMKMRMIYSNYLVGFLGKLSDWIHLKPQNKILLHCMC